MIQGVFPMHVGINRILHPEIDRTGVFPMHVGINRSTGHHNSLRYRVPHARGD